MEINFNADDFARWIGEICGSVSTVNENQYIYTRFIKDTKTMKKLS